MRVKGGQKRTRAHVDDISAKRVGVRAVGRHCATLARDPAMTRMSLLSHAGERLVLRESLQGVASQQSEATAVERENACLAQAAQAGGWVGRIGLVSLVVVIIGVVTLVRRRTAIAAILGRGSDGPAGEASARDRRVVLAWTAAMLCALAATTAAYLHMQNVIETCE